MNSSAVANACVLCSGASNTTSTQACSTSANITNGTRVSSGTQTCNGNYQTGPANNTTVGSGSCTGCSSYGSCSYSSYSCSCNSGYHAVNQGASTCSCEPDCVSDCTLNATQTASCTASNASAASGTQTCNATKNSVSGCYTWGAVTGCAATSCNANYYLSSGACNACTGVSFTDNTTDTSGCTDTSYTATGTITGGGSYKQAQTRTGSRNGTRTCYRTGGAGGTNGASACTGSANCTAWSYNTCSYTAWTNVGARQITCPAGTYWDGSACASCEAGYYCPGFSSVAETSLSNGYGRSSCTNKPANSSYSGSATTDACPWSCNAGYYGSSANGNTSCADCGSGNYCTGGTHRATCASTVKDGSPTPSSIRSLSSGNWSDANHGASSNDCICDWYFSDETRTSYLNQRTCSAGPGGHNYTKYYWCRPGYYATEPLNFNEWYNSCSPCTNAPANSTYTNYSTPSEIYAVESNCPWQCNDGYNLTSGNVCAQLCTAGATTLKLGGGITVPLYSAKQTTRVIGIGIGSQVCYGSLATGAATGALNVSYGGTTYHSID